MPGWHWPMSRACCAAESAPRRQDPVQRQFGAEPGLLQAPGHLARHVAAAGQAVGAAGVVEQAPAAAQHPRQLTIELLRVQLAGDAEARDRKSTRLNSSHVKISYAVFCLKKKNATADVSNSLNN